MTRKPIYNVERNQFEIPFEDIVAEMEPEQKRELAETLLWDQDIFNDLVERIATSSVVTDSFSTMVYHARIRLIELMPEMHQEMVRSLLHGLDKAVAEERRHTNWAWKLYHFIPHESRIGIPELDKYEYVGFRDDESVADFIKSAVLVTEVSE